jgi:type I restriction enzyme S subunit
MSTDKNKLIPELRFPEFENNGCWKIKKIENYFEVGSSKRVLQKDWTNKGVPFYRTRELVSLSKNEAFGSEIYISNKLYSELKVKYGVPSEGDFLVSGVGTLGISYQVKADDKFYFKDGNVIWFKLNGDLLSTYFKFCFESEHIQKQIKAQTSKSTVGTYTIQNARKTEFWLPPKIQEQEQQKIASCLSSLDEVIAAQSQKLATLKDHKKGLMQNLFPTNSITNDELEITNVPNYRFPEFLEDEGWVEKKLGDKEVSYFVNEKTSVDKLNVNSYVSTENMLPEFSGVSTSSKLPSLGNFTKFKNGDILISNIRPYLKKVWKADKIGGASNDVLVFRYGSEVLSEFLECIIKNEAFINYVMEGAKGVKMPRGDKDYMQKYIVFIPSKMEQQKIASCLSSLDDLITAQTEKIAQLKLHKKGLMQGFFP